MSLFSTLLAIAAMIGLFACILFIIFGQITVRKLRKNPETKEALGVEFASGWDILNVAQALALPRRWAKKLGNSSISFLYADSEMLYKYTNWLDRILARVFWWFYFISGVSLIMLVILNAFGVFGD